MSHYRVCEVCFTPTQRLERNGAGQMTTERELARNLNIQHCDDEGSWDLDNGDHVGEDDE